MVEPHAVFQVADGVLDLGVAAMVGLQIQGVPVSVGDESVIAVTGKQRQLGAGRGLYPADDETHRHGVGIILEGDVELVSEVQDHNDIRIMDASEDRIVLTTSNLP